jgi:hypothetical protein
MHACVVEHGDTTHLGPPRPVPPERRGRGVAVGAPPRRRPAVLLPAVAGSSAAAVDDARLLGPPRGRRAERQGAVHLLPPAAAVLTAAVAELSARHGEQQRERRAGRTRRELLQHPVLCSRCCCYFYQPGCSCSTRRGIYRDTDLRVVCSGNGNGCCQKRPVSGLCSRARRQSGRTAAGWERCERSSCAVPGVCACGSGRVGFLLYTDDDVQWLAFCGIAIWIQRRGERCVRVSCLSAAWRAVKGVRRAEGGSPMHSNCRRHGLVWFGCAACSRLAEAGYDNRGSPITRSASATTGLFSSSTPYFITRTLITIFRIINKVVPIQMFMGIFSGACAVVPFFSDVPDLISTTHHYTVHLQRGARVRSLTRIHTIKLRDILGTPCMSPLAFLCKK